MLFAGTFDSETYWREEGSSRLPSIPDPSRSRIVMAMDELLVSLCGPEDTLLTRFAMDEAHKDYMTRIGFRFTQLSAGVHNHEPNVFRALYEVPETDERLKRFHELTPFSVVPYVHGLLDRYNYSSRLPTLTDVKRVNSKLYSADLAKRLLGSSYSQPVFSADELATAGRGLMERTNGVMIKDPFGVAGKGNMLFKTSASLERVVCYFRKQEQNGSSTAFLVEPFLDVEYDFSCQFSIDEGGSYRIVGLQQIINRQFAYVGSQAMEEENVHSLIRNGYFGVIEQLASSLYKDGYFGHVCVDSMILKDGTLVPIVEINARQSMGLVSHRLGQRLNNGKHGTFTFRSVGSRQWFDYGQWLRQLNADGILYPNNAGEGIVPLSPACLFAGYGEAEYPQAAGEGGFIMGRLYLFVIASDVQERKRLIGRLREHFEVQGGKWYG
ncbi:phosphoribosylglycinamide formyltransferase 2 [Paenibacillus albidus]|uniref:Phosphoribosylglycinamide formyltransferase 2 n=1 Tax=Paenibacillus albidus TaxID=2041023 RepID=A0A917D6Q3_9BACL|nr:hypothetical protein [Paenibacillus albidus]GGG12829.1 phosphoribosylglycinamide formyltransferase 2 [Paenibacillus albidus]